MSVITVSRKFGSYGTYVGKKLAEELGYVYIDKDRIAEVMREYGFSNFDTIYDTIPSISQRHTEWRDRTINFLAEAILAIAHHGDVVIAGRGSFGLLDAFSDVVNIRIKAPMACRVHRIMEDNGISEHEARKLIKQKDKVRKSFVESDFRFDYNDTKEFDLILDTSIMPPDMCVKFLVEAHKQTDGKRDDNRPSVKQLNVEPVLVKHVNDHIARIKKQENPIIKRTEHL